VKSSAQGDRTAIHTLLDILADLNSNGRVHASESLYKIAEVGDGQLLRAASREESVRLQLMAAAALVRGGNLAHLAQIRKHLSSSDPETQTIAAWILGLLGDQSDIPPLQTALSQADDDLARSYFHHALACLGDSDGQASLRKNLLHSDPAIRTYSAEFAGYSRLQDVQETLIQLLEDDHLDVRVRAAQSLILLAHPPADMAEVLSVDVYQATPDNPRYSEGSVLALTDGTLAYATTEFIGGGADHATAHLVVRRSRDGGRTWSPSEVLQENVGSQNVMSVTLRRLRPGRHDGPIGLFYLVKNSPDDLHVHLKVSADEMQTWSESRQVTERPGYHVMNNDRVTVTSSGRLICPIAWTPHVTENGHFVCLTYFSDDGGKTWRESAGEVDEQQRGAMEPEIVELRDGRLMMIIRTQMGYIATSYSEDGGDHWSAPDRLSLQAPEAPSTIRRIPATGDLLLVWNNHYEAGAGHGGKRWPLTAAISNDEGKTWKQIRNLDAQPGEQYAYTSVEFFRDRALLTYYVHNSETGRISSRFRSLPVSWFYHEMVNQ
jgi:sialidase-1